MQNDEVEANRIADEVWREFQNSLSLKYNRPTLVMSDQQLQDRIHENQRKLNVPLCTPKLDYNPIRSGGLVQDVYCGEDGKCYLLLGPVSLAHSPLLTKVTLEHEFAHYVIHRSDPYYGIINSRLNEANELAGTFKENLQTLLAETSYMLYLFDEALAWTAPLTFSGIKKINKDLRSTYKYVTSKLPREEANLTFKNHIACVGIGCALLNRGNDINALLNPLATLINNWKLFDEDSNNSLSLICGAYDIEKNRGKINLYVDEVKN